MKDKLLNFAREVGKNTLESVMRILNFMEVGILFGIAVFTAFYVFVALYGWVR